MRKQVEFNIQKAVIAWFNHQFPKNKKYKLLTYTMGGCHNFGAKKGAIMKAMGLRSGTPDLNLFMARGGYHGLLIEVKGPDGKSTPTQKEMQSNLIEEGYCVKEGKSIEQCIEIIKSYLNGELIYQSPA